jgi:hypothetical protein
MLISMNSREVEFIDINIDLEEEAERQARYESYLKELWANVNKRSYLSASSPEKLNNFLQII